MASDEDPGPKQRLSAQSKQEIAALAGPGSAAFLGQAVMAWLVIALAIGIAHWAHNVFVTALCVVVIATRQNVLGLLTHEQAHYLGLKSKYGDWVCNAIASYPLLVLSVENYAKVHLTHHRHFFGKEDPDFVRKNGKDWVVPLSRKRLATLFLKDLLGLSVIALIAGKNAKVENQAFVRRDPTPGWFKIVYYVLAVAAITAAGVWVEFLIYWILPLLTVFQVIVRWGALCEHVYGVEDASVESCSPLIVNRWWERLLLPNLNFTYHPYHHYFPGVAYSRLPRVHEIFLREGLVNRELLFTSYWSYLKFVVRKPGPAAAG